MSYNPTRCFVVQDQKGNPLIGTKICATKAGAHNSMAPHINGMVDDKVGWQGTLSEIHQEAQKGYGAPKVIPDRGIDDFVQHMRNTPTYLHKQGNLDVTRVIVEEYNSIIGDIVDNWHVEEITYT